MEKIKVAIIGYGLSGRIFHGQILKSMVNYEVIGVLTRDSIKIELVKKDFPDAHIYKNVDEVFEDAAVELIIISTPNTTHFDFASRALIAGKHVVVEKPFTVTVAEAKDLEKLSYEKGKILSVYQNRRFDGDFKTVQEIISNGHLGRVVEFESHFDRFRPAFKENAWREKNLPGSGILYDLGAHLIDQALCLFGDPKEIYADISSQRQGEVDDHFEIILYYEALKVTLKSGSLVKENLPRFVLLGTSGSFVKFGMDPQEEALKNGASPDEKDWGSESPENWGILNTIDLGRNPYQTLNGDYREYYENIFMAIRHNQTLEVEANDGVKTMAIIECALKSHNEKKRIVF